MTAAGGSEGLNAMTQADKAPAMASDTTFVAPHTWSKERPRILVVACSDGRYQQSLDEFLDRHLGITTYDRLYAPGGPGAMASSTFSYFRGEQFRQDAAFLVAAHALDAIVFIFHGPALREGPDEATCADYRRKMPGASTSEIHCQQEADLQEAVKAVTKVNPAIEIEAFRAEVRADGRVQFVPLKTP
jgi:hypothetical protein